MVKFRSFVYFSVFLLSGTLQAASNPTACCQCVKYVESKLRIACGSNAKDCGTALTKSGYKLQKYPSKGQVIVVQPGGIVPKYGHIGFVDTIESDGSIRIKGANQIRDCSGSPLYDYYNKPSSQVTDGVCNNISARMKISKTKSGYANVVAFYAK